MPEKTCPVRHDVVLLLLACFALVWVIRQGVRAIRYDRRGRFVPHVRHRRLALRVGRAEAPAPPWAVHLPGAVHLPARSCKVLVGQALSPAAAFLLSTATAYDPHAQLFGLFLV